MKEKYVTPEVEIIEFEEEACVTMSGGNDNIFDMGESGWE